MVVRAPGEICRNCIDGQCCPRPSFYLRGSEDTSSAPRSLRQMKRRFFNVIAGGILGLALGFGWSLPTLAQGDPLPSWNDTSTKQAIVEFVGRVTKPGGPD